MKRLIFWGMSILIGILGMTLICYADFDGVPSWDYEHNDNVPCRVDEKGNQIPNIYINDTMILVDVYGKWSQEAITYCAKQGYLDGMLVRKFDYNPYSYVDKAELSMLLGRKAKIDYSKYKKDFFTDIRLQDYDLSGTYDYTDWYVNFTPYYVNWAGLDGILKGNGQGALNNSELDREQAATIIDRFVEKHTHLYDGLKFDEDLSFKDKDEILSWAEEGVVRLSKIKVFNGDSKGFFNPHQSISREEICQIIFNLEKQEGLN